MKHPKKYKKKSYLFINRLKPNKLKIWLHKINQKKIAKYIKEFNRKRSYHNRQ